ncbi:MAG: hypothetical protein O3B87_00130 [bacterium]|nr:hypothetical protein [bacterium]
MHKVIFYVLLVLEVIGLITLAQDFPMKFIDNVGVILELLTMFALYSYVYHKKHLSQTFWKNTFYVLGIWWLFDLVDLLFFGQALWEMLPDFFQTGFEYSKGAYMFGLMIQAYFLYIVYQLGFKKGKSKK